MIQLNLFSPEEQEVISKANYRCIVCRMLADTLHHEPPKSRNPKWMDMPKTWFVLCYKCHDKVHNMSRKDAIIFLG